MQNMSRKSVLGRFAKEKKSFQTIKTSAQKTTKIFIFSKGLVHGFCQKNGDFFIFSFCAKWIKKKCFGKVPKEKKPFQTKKTSAQKTTNICIVSKGLVSPWFLSKMEIILSLVFMQNRLANVTLNDCQQTDSLARRSFVFYVELLSVSYYISSYVGQNDWSFI